MFEENKFLRRAFEFEDIPFALERRTHRPEIIIILDGCSHDGSLLFINFKLGSHARKGRQNVTEQNAAVGFVVAPRLQRNFHSNFGNFGALTKGGILLDEITVFFDVTSRLSHCNVCVR